MATKLHNNCEHCQVKQVKKSKMKTKKEKIHYNKKGRCLCRWDIEPKNTTTKKNKVTCGTCQRILLR